MSKYWGVTVRKRWCFKISTDVKFHELRITFTTEHYEHNRPMCTLAGIWRDFWQNRFDAGFSEGMQQRRAC